MAIPNRQKTATEPKSSQADWNSVMLPEKELPARGRQVTERRLVPAIHLRRTFLEKQPEKSLVASDVSIVTARILANAVGSTESIT